MFGVLKKSIFTLLFLKAYNLIITLHGALYDISFFRTSKKNAAAIANAELSEIFSLILEQNLQKRLSA